MDKIQVFFSYAHADHTPGRVTNTSWLSELFDQLFYELKVEHKRSHYGVLLDRDGAINYGGDIDTSVTEAVKTCDIALLFLSPSYCASPNCADEVQQLLDMGKTVIPVEIERHWKTTPGHALGSLMEDLTPLKRFSFFEENDRDGPRVGFPEPSKLEGEDYKKFRLKAWNLAKTVKEQTRDLIVKRQSAAASVAHATGVNPLPPEETDVCIAAPTSDARTETERLEKALIAADITVQRIDLSNPAYADDHAEMAKFVGHSNLYIQVVGGLPGRGGCAGTQWTATQAQYQAAQRAEVESHIWCLPDLSLEDCDDEHRAFIESSASHMSSFEDFERLIIQRVELRRQQVASEKALKERMDNPNGAQGHHAPIFVAIDVSEEERHLGEMIEDALQERGLDSGAWIEETPDREEFVRAVRENDAVVLVYGEDPGGQKRARSHFMMFRKAVYKAKRKAFRVAVGNSAPPPPEAPPPPGGKGVHMIKLSGDLDEQALAQFISELSPMSATA